MIFPTGWQVSNSPPPNSLINPVSYFFPREVGFASDGSFALSQTYLSALQRHINQINRLSSLPTMGWLKAGRMPAKGRLSKSKANRFEKKLADNPFGPQFQAASTANSTRQGEKWSVSKTCLVGNAKRENTKETTTTRQNER
ncbi:MAG: hypothetical protein WBL50_18610 [Candidatus Acidiferrum sp.]